MPRKLAGVLIVVWTCLAIQIAASAADPPHVVFVLGEDEYKSEQTMPTIAKELSDKYGMKCTLAMAPDVRNPTDIAGLEALETADLAVFFVRFRKLPEDQLNRILAYVNSGKPVVAMRTSTHAFLYPQDSPLKVWNDRFGQEILGQKWLYHYGHDSSTDVEIIPAAKDNPILTGVDPKFHCRSWLYYVLPLPDGITPLLQGTSVEGSTTRERVVNPVAWTWEPKGGRVFYTSLGHPEDFQVPSVRRLVINGIHWALDKPVPSN